MNFILNSSLDGLELTVDHENILGFLMSNQLNKVRFQRRVFADILLSYFLVSFLDLSERKSLVGD